MKKILVALVSALSILPSMGRATETAPVTTDSTYDLAVESSSAHFRVDYPGLGRDAVCSIVLTLHPAVYATVNDLKDILVVEETFDHQVMPLVSADNKTAYIKLKLNLYVTAFSISTRDGRPLKQVLAEKGIFQHHLLLLGLPCP